MIIENVSLFIPYHFNLIMVSLKDKKIAILTENGFEEIELTSPKQALEEAGATVHIISLQDKVKAWNHDDWSIELSTDVSLKNAKPEDYDALMIPGGVINPDSMRRQKEYINFASAFIHKGKPVAAICHGPQLLIETGALKGRTVTSFPSIKTDLINAGAIWQDEEVVVDNGLVTSRSPKDLPAFNKKMTEEFAEGTHSTAASFVPTH
jgi:protease I